jgi:hypothetical protein
MMEGCLESKEPTSNEIQSVAEHEEVPEEKAVVKTIRTLKKWHGDWHLAIRHHQHLQKQTQGDSGSQTKLTATHRGLTCHAISAMCKELDRQEPSRDSVARGTLKGWMFGKKHRVQLDCINGIRD